MGKHEKDRELGMDRAIAGPALGECSAAQDLILRATFKALP